MTIAPMLVAFFGVLASAAPSTISVCQAAHVADQLNGKTVRISGIWQRSFPKSQLFDELVDAKCPDVQIRVVTTSASLAQPPPANYKLDLKSAQHARDLAEKTLTDGRDLDVIIVGILYVQKEEDYVAAKPLNKDVTIPPHHKWYPLVLLVQSVPYIKEH